MVPMDTLENYELPHGRRKGRGLQRRNMEGARAGDADLCVAGCVQQPDSGFFSGSWPTFPLKRYQACSLWGSGPHPEPSPPQF